MRHCHEGVCGLIRTDYNGTDHRLPVSQPIHTVASFSPQWHGLVRICNELLSIFPSDISSAVVLSVKYYDTPQGLRNLCEGSERIWDPLGLHGGATSIIEDKKLVSTRGEWSNHNGVFSYVPSSVSLSSFPSPRSSYDSLVRKTYSCSAVLTFCHNGIFLSAFW